MLFTEIVAFKFNLQIDHIIILQFFKKNKYEKLVKRNGVLTFFADFAKLMTSLHVLLKLVRKCFFEIFYNILLFANFFFHFSSSGKGGVFFLSKYKKLNFCKTYLNGHTFQKYYLLGVTL